MSPEMKTKQASWKRIYTPPSWDNYLSVLALQVKVTNLSFGFPASSGRVRISLSFYLHCQSLFEFLLDRQLLAGRLTFYTLLVCFYHLTGPEIWALLSYQRPAREGKYNGL